MTELRKRVVRRTAERFVSAGRRPLVVTLEPGDLVGVREFGARMTYRITVEALYRQLVRGAAEWERAKRRGRGQPVNRGMLRRA